MGNFIVIPNFIELSVDHAIRESQAYTRRMQEMERHRGGQMMDADYGFRPLPPLPKPYVADFDHLEPRVFPRRAMRGFSP